MELNMAERRKTARAQDRNAQTCRPEKYGQREGPEGEFGAAEICSREAIAKALVAARDPGERRARSETRRVQTDRPEEDRGFPQALGGTQFASQGGRLSLRALDVDILYQPCRQDLAENATRPLAARQDRAEAPVSSRRVIAANCWYSRHTRESGYPVIAGLSKNRDIHGVLDHPLSRMMTVLESISTPRGYWP